ncbi:hypothetical protein HPB48_011902 [Haemaphysalis longicornis]|uniref:ABC transporter domain-containing protein n=1 Tax=Haemaphysalis longicornis TaxID=44386 RepID=A0A9J6FPC9_HAELO|nr:hypothetical protein HPB48_011902 [Haemaphysalis longicornis]
MADTLSCVRLVKLYAWEDAVTEAVHTYRRKENFLLFLTNLLDGFIDSLQNSSTTAGRMAYVPQDACIFSMSLRDNVLFGKALQTLRYNQVLEACELTSDLAMFPAGDLTEVGEKGETLSGGQKQRVALARAAYSNSDIYLLDDTLSALDVHVAAKVFAQVIGPKGLLRNKARGAPTYS